MDNEERIAQQLKESPPSDTQALIQMLMDMHRQDREDIQKAIEAANQAAESARNTHRDRKITITMACVCFIMLLIFGIVMAVTSSGLVLDFERTTTTQSTDSNNDTTFNNVSGDQYNDEATNKGGE